MREYVSSIAIFFGVVFIGLVSISLYVKGITWVGTNFFSGMTEIASWLLAFNVFGGFLFAVKSIRPYMGAFYLISSYFYGSLLFLISFLSVYISWGFWGTIISIIVLPGIGWVPSAFLISFLTGDIDGIGILSLSLALTFGTRIIGIKAIES